MDVPVLVATDTPPFGMLIQQTLEASGRFKVTVVDNGRQALEQAEKTPFVLCILDCDLADMTLPDLVWGLREANLTARLVLVPPGNEPSNPLVAGLSPAGFLTKPFYLPDLLETIDKILGTPAQPTHVVEPLPISFPMNAQVPLTPDPRVPSWLQDVTRAAQHLTRLSLESAAQAALIVQEGQVWAYAGELPQPAGQELAQVVAQYWGRDGVSDLARFVRLKSVGGEYMLYATSLVGGLVLALVFDVETPFSKIRSQAGRLARLLESPPGNDVDAAPAVPLAAAQKEQPEWSDDSDDYDEETSDRELPPLPPLFDDVPPPSPNAPKPSARPAWSVTPSWSEEEMSPGQKGFLRVPQAELEDLDSDDAGESEPVKSFPSPEWLSAAELSASPAENQSPAPQAEPIVLPVGALTELEPRPETSANEMDSLAETRPILVSKMYVEPAAPVGDETQVIDLQTASGAVCSLHYACLLLPRLPQHHLIGEPAVRLAEWMPQLSMAFGWRLEHLAIRPEYVQWIISVPPSTSPSYLIRVIRQHTSERIFTTFTGLAVDNPSGDFWAPGYLIMSSQNPVPPDVTQDFIRQTRHRQGASRPIPRQY